MRFYFLLLVLEILASAKVQGIRCRNCFGHTNTDVGQRCLFNSTTAYLGYCRSSYYCLTTIEYSDGIISSVRRRCQSPYNDYDTSTLQPPSGNACYTTYRSPGSAKCHYPCNYTDCNNGSPKLPEVSPSPTFAPSSSSSTLSPLSSSTSSSPSSCPTSCPSQCDSKGKCINSSLQCVQCNSDFDSNCTAKTSTSTCKKGQRYCSFVTVKSLDAIKGTSIRQAVIKGCSSASGGEPKKSCSLSFKISYTKQPYKINYVCNHLCSTSGCNSAFFGQPNQSPQSELSCIVCSQKGGYLDSNFCMKKTSASSCPRSARYCKATVKYYIAKGSITKGSALSKIAYIIRECASEPTDKKCTSSTIDDTDLEAVTCQETCETSGCNTGWPARPLCSQCHTKSYDRYAFENCFRNPPTPTICPSPAHTFCKKSIKNIGNVEGYTREVVRECAYESGETNCAVVKIGDSAIRNCQTFCNTDGCNQGIKAGIPQ